MATADLVPDLVTLNTWSDASDFPAFAQACLAECSALGFGGAVEVNVDGGPPLPLPLPVEAPRAPAAAGVTPTRALIVSFESGSWVLLERSKDGCECHLSLPTSGSRDNVVARVRAALEAGRALLRAVPGINVMHASRLGGSRWRCAPYPPLAQPFRQLLYVRDEDVQTGYGDADAFASSGWELREQVARGWLLARALSAGDDAEYLSSVVPQTWALARAARAGLTKYFDPAVADMERPIYGAGDAVVLGVGHVSGDNVAEFSCALAPGQHIPGWQIYDLRGLVKTRALPGGRTVDRVRVVFLTEEMARGERRPLLDNRIEVAGYAHDGTLVELRD